jgi:hypothetical protein
MSEKAAPKFLAPYTCPKCGSTDYDEMHSKDRSEAVGYACRCLRCRTEYTHWSNIDYIPYGVEVDGVTYEYPSSSVPAAPGALSPERASAGKPGPLDRGIIDPETCPRCGHEWTEAVGLDRDREEQEEFLPDEVRSCPECEKRESEHHDGTYRLSYRKSLACVSWTDDAGVEHIVHDTGPLVREAAGDLYRALERITRCAKARGPAGTTVYFISDELMEQAKAGVARAKGGSRGHPDRQ